MSTCVLLAVYLLGYLVLRDQNYIIHRAGYAGASGSSGPAVANHWVHPGEKHILVPLDAAIYVAYSPSMWVEEQIWYLIHPEGSPWPY